MRTSLLLLLPALTFLAPSAWATLTIHEPFAYTGASLANENGGTGFSGAWPAGATTHTLSSSGTSLTYPPSSPLTPQGNRLEISTTTGGITASRGISATMSLAPNGLGFYASALVSIGQLGQTTSVQFTDGTNVRFSYGINAAGNFFSSIDPGAGTQVATSSTIAALNTTYLVVAYIRTNTGPGTPPNDEVFVSAFAPTDTVVFPATDSAWQASANGNSGVTLNQMRILANNPDAGGSTIQLDEIRVGTTFQDVTGVIPEPGSALLSGLALALGLVRRKR